jgi:hypothetical protein
VTERLRIREIDGDEGRRLVWIIRRGTGSVVTWRRELDHGVSLGTQSWLPLVATA